MRPHVPPRIGYGPGQRPAPAARERTAKQPFHRPGPAGRRGSPGAGRGSTGGVRQHQQAEAVSRSITDPDLQAQALALT
jgi:hypothetical protein